jgi:hypothetical protein
MISKIASVLHVSQCIVKLEEYLQKEVYSNEDFNY